MILWERVIAPRERGVKRIVSDRGLKSGGESVEGIVGD
jgi:hypothetical protein